MARHYLSSDEMDHFEVDDSDGRLYWKGQQVVTEKVVSLQTYERILATVAAIGAILAGVHPFGHSFGWW